MPSRLDIVSAKIRKHLDSAPHQVFTRGELQRIFTTERDGWNLAKRTTTDAFIAYLISKKNLHQIDLHSEEYGELLRYGWGSEVDPLEVALSVRRGAYLSHGTAVYLHKLTMQLPRTIHINKEQTPKPAPKGGLSQAAIDRAFAGRQRSSNYVFRFGEHQVVVISGKNTKNLGVIQDGRLAYTDIERTLLDITVRPSYAGGVPAVLEAFTSARESASVNRIYAYLKQIDYVYPYGQLLGFYLERAGFPASRLARLRAEVSPFDFYLDYGLVEPAYDSTWRVFYPKLM